ncbi:leucyl aminopeptidase [Herbiconiux moechotypicola]|uniref:Probable cytosol aminopeptidase n=1 Tax=Herbiconiux moechotypicola TaxID=637393 RepID=A0ABP5QFC5_9MICO|nr:leucyl aminopeptidase [Herbiconiux moechotypicola]MCS5729987.1 leucyl aminopeptidase [Herbiconiux moechotypicola]
MPSAFKLIPDTFDPVPSRRAVPSVDVVTAFSPDLGAVGHVVPGTADGVAEGAVPVALGLDAAALARAGFTGKRGQTLVLPQAEGPVLVAIGAGVPDDSESPAAATTRIRDLAAALARATTSFGSVGLVLDVAELTTPELVGQAVAEGLALARYRYAGLKAKPKGEPLERAELLLTADEPAREAATAGIARGLVLAAAENLARDLANTPPGHLTATDLADTVAALGPGHGLEVEVFDKAALIELGAGGLLGVNAGSVEEPRMVVIRYTPAEASAHLALVGKGITYDSGGISLKPSNPMHALMKMDMAGAAAVVGTMTALQALGSTTAVTAYLMCTDNMPSGSATKLGDVLTIRGGKTVEVKNTDAEGRLVMSDALALAAEQKPDAIVDIATLTGSAMMTLGTATAAVFANDQALAEQVKAAAAAVDEPVWQLPLERKYRPQLDSDVADLSNMGGPYAGATIAALFLDEFVDGLPWAHLDIAGTMNSDKDDSWRPKGATGFGTRLLAELALTFEKVR